MSSITASRILTGNRAELEKAMERLASGKRINSAADDAAGMAVAAKMRADIRSLNQAVRNTNDAISLVNTYDGAATEVESILIRMRELAVQAKTGTYTDADLTNANYEYDALKTEIVRITATTTFNRLNIAGASGTTGGTGSAANSLTFYVGADTARTGNSIVFSGESLNLNMTVSASDLKTITSTTNATSAVASVDDALITLAVDRARAGAMINRLEHTVSNLMNISQRLQEAVSGVEDTDYAEESANLAKGMILQQAGTAMLAQANQTPQYVLLLLRS
ncbi:MAG: flagellin FliC [Gammaproteobacteria bacterium]|nr:flagellin FliC [Gammaproteobacteria bacterium]